MGNKNPVIDAHRAVKNARRAHTKLVALHKGLKNKMVPRDHAALAAHIGDVEDHLALADSRLAEASGIDADRDPATTPGPSIDPDLDIERRPGARTSYPGFEGRGNDGSGPWKVPDGRDGSAPGTAQGPSYDPLARGKAINIDAQSLRKAGRSLDVRDLLKGANVTDDPNRLIERIKDGKVDDDKLRKFASRAIGTMVSFGIGRGREWAKHPEQQWWKK